MKNVIKSLILSLGSVAIGSAFGILCPFAALADDNGFVNTSPDKSALVQDWDDDEEEYDEPPPPPEPEEPQEPNEQEEPEEPEEPDDYWD